MYISDFKYDCAIYDNKEKVEYASVVVHTFPWSWKGKRRKIYKNISYWKWLDNGEFVPDSEWLTSQVEALQMRQLYDKFNKEKANVC